jgi:hypothetical protein
LNRGYHFWNWHIFLFITRDVFTSTLFQTHVKVWLTVHEAVATSCFFCHCVPLKCTFFSLIIFIIYLYITSFTVFIFLIFFIAAVLQNFMQPFTNKMFHQQLCNNNWAVSLMLHHTIWHIVHKNKALYLYRMKVCAKLMVVNPKSCL